MAVSFTGQLLYSTVRITALRHDRALSYGTGFLWRVDEGQRCGFSLITNKHVLEGADQIEVTFHLADADHQPLPGKFDTYRMAVEGALAHPDESVDLVSLGIGGLMNDAVRDGRPIFTTSMNLTMLPGPQIVASLSVIEDVIMVGYPRAIYDSVNNVPVIRRGITATPVHLNYEGRREFMIDIASFSGSSGSPVFIYQRDFVDDRGARLMGAERMFLLGVLYAGPLFTNQGIIKFQQPPAVLVDGSMHLGQVIRFDEIQTLDACIRQRLIEETQSA